MFGYQKSKKHQKNKSLFKEFVRMLNFGYSSGEKDTKLNIRIGISLT